MERREVLKGIAFITAGAVLFPHCKSEILPSKYSKLANLSSENEVLIKELCHVILPVKGTPLQPIIPAEQFVLMSVNDCYAPEDQSLFLQGMNSFNLLLDGQSLEKLSVDKQKELIGNALNDRSSEHLKMFVKTTKDLTLRNVTTSQLFMEKYRDYKMLPGTYIACKQIS